MNIYESFITSTGAKKAELNTKQVLEKYIDALKNIESKVKYNFNSINEIKETLNKGDYSTAYIKEYIEHLTPKINENLDSIFNTNITSMEEELKFLKERAMATKGDKQISNINMIKLQSVLPNLTDEDKKSLFENSKDKDPNVSEVLYMSIKNREKSSLGIEIKEYLEEYTGNKEINMVSELLEQIKGLRSYLTYDYVSSLDNAYQEQALYSMQPEGAINRIIGAYIQDINNKIAELE